MFAPRGSSTVLDRSLDCASTMWDSDKANVGQWDTANVPCNLTPMMLGLCLESGV